MSDLQWLTPEAEAEQAEKGKSAVVPRFYTRQVEHKGKSLEAGRPIFVELEYVEIRIVGDNKNVIDTKVQEKHRRRWPKQYTAYKEGKEQVLEGTPIRQWASLSATRALELEAVGVRTVEQLASIPDSSLHHIGMDGMSLKVKANAYLKTAQESGFSERLAVQNKQLQDDLDFLKAKMGPLIDKLDQLSTEVDRLKGDTNDQHAQTTAISAQRPSGADLLLLQPGQKIGLPENPHRQQIDSGSESE